MKLPPLVLLCLLPGAWPRNFLIKTYDKTDAKTDNTTDAKTDDQTDVKIDVTTKIDDSVEEAGVDYYGSNYEESEEEFRPTKTTCEEFSRELPKMCKKVEDGTIMKSGEDIMGGLGARWRRDIYEMEIILRWNKMYDNPAKDKRLVSTHVNTSSR